ncbi:cytochrome P450 4C1 isoform X2 [Folsomia candida]|uniref:cytochrome P450 4C1 isoform X2 n=1 Tax=Folsomia candida TaxID=158441 RepID=UPI001604D60B|nr:cytochrome P450 4C1 isoform X2 [Folsomia candida]XP_035706448.1 cytochrome P450 4C1 isoform X2 [Folsomia candida]
MPPLLIAFFVLTAIFYTARHIKLRLKLAGINGPKGIPIFGNVFELIGEGNVGVVKALTKFRDEHGSRVVMWLGLNPYLIISNGNDIEKVLSSQQHIEKSWDYDLLVPWLGRGLLTSTGSLWHSRRKLLTPAFHFAILEDFLTIMCEQGDILVNVLETKKGSEFDIFPIITRAALDIICETAMGEKINAQRKTDSQYVKAVYRISDLIQYRQLRPWLHNDTIWSWSPSGREEIRLLKTLHNFTDSVIQKRKRMRDENGKSTWKKPAFLDLLLDHQAKNPGSLSDICIREEVDTFMFEGHDTTAANINWTLYLLGCYPKIQAKVQEEIDSVLGSGSGGKIPSGDLAKLKYLECCIKESLRIYPSVPLIGRKLAGELKLDLLIFSSRTEVMSYP